jgi:hypothetical protein
VLWQTGPGLLPVKQSTIRFIYIAYLFPFLALLAFSRPPPPHLQRWCGVYLAVLFVASLPVAFFYT